MTECAVLRGGPCHWDDVCALHWVWASARDALCDELSGGPHWPGWRLTTGRWPRDNGATPDWTPTVPAHAAEPNS